MFDIRGRAGIRCGDNTFPELSWWAACLGRASVPLENIRELDEVYWSNDGHGMTCRQVVDHVRLMEEADLADPVILSSDGRVMDGMHRICKALLLGHGAIEAVRFESDPEPDYVGVHPDNLPYVDSE